MTVISIIVDESSEQLIAGFPKTVSLATNIPSTIFYTIDGSEPTTLSSVYTSPIVLPTDVLTLILKIFATNGTDNSPIVTLSYSTDILVNTRLSHSLVAGNQQISQSLYPFGSNSPDVSVEFLNPANSGNTVNNPNLPIIPYGYDANNNQVGANKPIDQYLNVYSTTDNRNRVYNGVGNLPGKVTVLGRRSALEYNPEESNRSSGLFNPKAMVIFQDSTNEDPTNPIQINKQFFSLENLEIVKDGSALYASGLDTPTITGSYIKSYYNPRTQMMTSYFRDSSTNRWIISSSPYTPKSTDVNNLSGMVFSKYDQGVGRIFTWNLFLYRTLT